MFSANQHYYIESLLSTYVPEGYSSYIAYTNTNTSYYSTEPDLYIIFSKDEIVAKNGYDYDIPSGALKISIFSGNYSSNSSANNSERVVVSEFKQGSLSIDSYEHIYTNAKFETYALQPDYYRITGGHTNAQVKTISFILLAVFIYTLISKLWRSR